METGCYYYRARYYCSDPVRGGRFLQTDPVGYKDDLNLYTYVGNVPTDRIDPLGMNACSRVGSDDCSGSYDGDGTTAQRNKATNDALQHDHPKEYAAMTQAYKNITGKSFDPRLGNAHSYEGEESICASGDGCSRQTVFNALTHCPTPSGCSPDAYKNGASTFAWPVGMVHTYVDESNDWVMNVTIPGQHLLNPGVVLRESVDRGDHIGVLSLGIGTGMMPMTNYLLGKYVIWNMAAGDLRNYMFNPMWMHIDH